MLDPSEEQALYRLKRGNWKGSPMSVWGHKRTSTRPILMSALPPKPDIRRAARGRWKKAYDVGATRKLCLAQEMCFRNGLRVYSG